MANTCAVPEMDELDRTTKLIVNQCGNDMIQSYERTRKFEISFISLKAANTIRDNFRKIEVS
jgi:hypothetical protein